MDKIKFERAMNALLAFKDIPIDHDKNKKFYDLMKNDFTDAEFAEICGDICKTERLYNKYPDPCLFYQRKPKPNVESLLDDDCQKFLDKVSDYLTSGFISTDDRQEFNTSLTDTEKKVLSRFGGISTLWESCNRDDYARSVDGVLRELKRDFEDAWEVQTTGNGVLRLTYGTPKSIEPLTQNLLKHWSA